MSKQNHQKIDLLLWQIYIITFGMRLHKNMINLQRQNSTFTLISAYRKLFDCVLVLFYQKVFPVTQYVFRNGI